MKNLGELNNNPLNIRFNPFNDWQGQTGSHKGFCVFKSNAYGFRAGYKLLCNYIANGYNTLESIISRWAPIGENNTESYIDFVCTEAIMQKDDVIGNATIHDYWTIIIILQAMAKFETGQYFDEQQINLFINYPYKF